MRLHRSTPFQFPFATAWPESEPLLALSLLRSPLSLTKPFLIVIIEHSSSKLFVVCKLGFLLVYPLWVTPLLLRTISRQVCFKSCASCPHSFSVSDEHQSCLYCLSKVHVITHCSICRGGNKRTHEARELCLCKPLLEEAMCQRAQLDPGPADPLE